MNFSRISARVVPRNASPASSQEELANHNNNSLAGDIMVTQRVSISVKDRDGIAHA